MAVRLKKYSFRFSEELFNSRLAQKSEIVIMLRKRMHLPVKLADASFLYFCIKSEQRKWTMGSRRRCTKQSRGC